MDIALIEFDKGRQEEQPDQSLASSQPNQIEEQEGIPQPKEEVEGQQVTQAAHQGGDR